MVLLGLLFMIVAVAAGVVVFTTDTAATTTMPIRVLDRTLELSQSEIFLAGIVAAVIFVIGLSMLSGGLRRTLMLRRDLRRTRGEARRARRLEEEKRELERRLGGSAPAAPTHAPAAASEGPATGPMPVVQPDARPGRHAAGEDAPAQRPVPQERAAAAHEDDKLVAGSRRPGDGTRH
ncbi:hypothetical protein [Spongiactinospora sp. TRM90649]|uniref:hypothetical protein n=1 Tax=Spongiactinospora sp. TRM90649 TaxID=3031114 RepID=UPI0023F94AEF|nr:hypothetical protein [Spongiactinospora sp. TRM90649]MDF5757554.1 hypothetical protein [Spongiactinospora sp. TRM90649]